jgi:predicted dehydrogenase
MKTRPIAPVLVGSGMAGQAILKSLAIVSQTDAELELLPVRRAARGTPLRSFLSDQADNVLFLANPSGMHAQSIAEGVQAGFTSISVEKPVCVRAEEIDALQPVDALVTVFHGYRTMWGARTIKSMIESGDLGEVFSFESRYWQSSSAQMALKGTPEKRAWKNDPHLNGPWDALTDLGSHVMDICLYLMPGRPVKAKCWVSYKNSAAAHRDTHVQMSLSFVESMHALASISKTMHGATNDFEFTIIGTKGSATWRFLRPDEVEYGSGNRISIIRREMSNAASGTAPFHSLGWLEGYVEITRQTLRKAAGLASTPVPTLSEALVAMDVLLNATIEPVH